MLSLFVLRHIIDSKVHPSQQGMTLTEFQLSGIRVLSWPKHVLVRTKNLLNTGEQCRQKLVYKARITGTVLKSKLVCVFNLFHLKSNALQMSILKPCAFQTCKNLKESLQIFLAEIRTFLTKRMNHHFAPSVWCHWSMA